MPENLRIRGLEIPADIPELVPLEKHALVQFVEERFGDVEREMGKHVVDTSRLALLTAVTIAHDLLRLRAETDAARNQEERKIDGIIAALEDVVKK
jgi:cell division protein ZapA (FtsZ GTPase activity inhibitor)